MTELTLPQEPAPPLSPKDIDFWQQEIENGKQLMKTRSEDWTRLLKRLELDFPPKIRGMSSDETVKISRFKPIVRQLVAQVSFNYPRLAIAVEEAEGEEAEDLLERVANKALSLMQADEEVRQAIFDALFACVGWLKIGYNPPGDDSIAPYVANDVLHEDFPYVQRVDPTNVFLDPLCPPHKLGHARYIIERMLVPLDFVKTDARFTNTEKVRPFKGTQESDDLMGEWGVKATDGEESDAINKSLDSGNMALLFEVHDRIGRRRITFADGVEEPIENIPSPFLRQRSVTQLDEFGNEIDTGIQEDTGEYLLESGFQYFALKFDQTGHSFYGQPTMAYVEDTENVIIESMTRRIDILKRLSRLVAIAKAEVNNDSRIKEVLKRARDGDIIELTDVNNIGEVPIGSVPSDQLSAEDSAQAYERDMVMVADASATPGKSATEATLEASTIQLNREWMQKTVADAYGWIAHSALTIMGDQRYTPERFILNVAQEGAQAVNQVLQQADFLWDFRIDVQADSMQPLIAERDREAVLQLYSLWRGNPNIDQVQLDRFVGQSFNIPNIDKLFVQDGNVEATHAAQTENLLLMQGQDPGVIAGMDHQAHNEVHNQLQVSPGTIQAQAKILHMQAHQAAFEQELGQGTTPSTDVDIGPTDLQGAVQSNAQTTQQAIAG